MDNQIYRIEMSGGKNLEFSICNTNELEPYRKTKEISVTQFGGGEQIDGSLNVNELISLIDYLENCKEYIQEYNATSKPEIKQP